MSRILIMTRGLPGSGKSAWAEEHRVKLESQGLKVFVSNKDEIRKALGASGWVWSHEAEKDVLKVQNEQIRSAYDGGINVTIVADCNFGKHKERLQGLAVLCNADFEIKDFTSVPLATCIDRDQQRAPAYRVGTKVITDMYNQYIAGVDAKPYVPNHRNPRAIICDIDGTIALHKDRSPYDLSKVGQDALNEPIADIVRAYAGYKGYTIIYLSGREDSCRQATEDWLAKMHLPTDPPHILLMRKAKDHRKDWIVKQELFDTYVRDNYWVKFVLDDRNQVVKMWRKLGLTCLQVADGDF
jgi:predicted kinase